MTETTKKSTTGSVPALYVGIDWADKRHDAHWMHSDGRAGKQQIEHSAEAVLAVIDEWVKLAEGGSLVVAVEKSRAPLVAALIGRPEFTLFLIDPKQFSRYRESFSSGGAKSDGGDAALLARMIRERHAELAPVRLDDDRTRRIGFFAETRRDFVEELKGLNSQLLVEVKTCFPWLLECGAIDSPLVLEFLRRNPDPRVARRLHPATLRALFRRHRWKNDDQVRQLIDRLRETPPLVTDGPRLDVYVYRVAALGGQIQAVQKQIDQLESAIAQDMASHPDANLFQSLPGAGKALAPRLLTAFGSDRDRFPSADAVAVTSGIAPVMKQSGQTSRVSRRRACPHFMKQTFHEFADHARKWCPWSKAYYRWLRSKNMGHHATLRKLASRWIRILFRVWQSRTEYAPDRYLRSLQCKNHPALAFLDK